MHAYPGLPVVLLGVIGSKEKINGWMQASRYALLLSYEGMNLGIARAGGTTGYEPAPLTTNEFRCFMDMVLTYQKVQPPDRNPIRRKA